MKTLKEFINYELTVVGLAFAAMFTAAAVALIIALAGNEHPTTDQTVMAIFLAAFFVAMAILMVWVTIDDFRNRVRK